MTPQDLSARILAIAPEHGLPALTLRAKRSSALSRVVDRVRRVVYPTADQLTVRGDEMLVPPGQYWNPPPPHVVIHELGHAEQRERLGPARYRLRYGSLGILHTLSLPVVAVPLLLSVVVGSVPVARALFGASLLAEMLALGLTAPCVCMAFICLLLAGYAPFCSPMHARLEFEAYVLEGLFTAWAQDMAWDPRFVRRYGKLPARQLQWIHATVTGPGTHWAVRSGRGRRMLAEVSRAPEELLLRYPRVFALWRQLHEEHTAHIVTAAPSPTAATAVTTPKP